MIHVAVVGHISRQERAESLAESLDAELFLDRLSLGATWNHLRALNWAAGLTGHLIVLEDDAVPVPGFADVATDWIERRPRDLISFYLGTGYPPHYQPRIATAIAEADEAGRNTIELPALIHAVAYAIPCAAISGLNLNPRRPADLGLGLAWGRTVIYTLPSLVDHADDHSIQNAGRRHAPRKAWRL